MKTNRLIGSILLISGTTVGGGMLALPVVSGIYGFATAISTLTVVWFVNVLIALALLEANLRLPPGTNLITMARSTLGRPGEIIAWGSCLLFLYAILVAYSSGLHELISSSAQETLNLTIPAWLDIPIIVGTFSIFIYSGTRFTDYTNRIFMAGLGITFLLLLFYIAPFINLSNLNFDFNAPTLALPIVFTSFGYLIVIPTVRTYLNSDIKKIRISILIGSLIPLILYITWVSGVISIIPINGTNGLNEILTSGDPGTGIIKSISIITSHTLLTNIAKLFVFFSVATSFVGVSLGLFDFLADGLKINKDGKGKLLLTMITFLPPLIFTLLFKKLFITALGYAALFSVVIFGACPALMAWSGRSVSTKDQYRLMGGKYTLALILLFSALVFTIEITKILHLI